jgi:hypothetical protein
MSSQSEQVTQADAATMEPVAPSSTLFPDSNHASRFQFTEVFNRYVTGLVDR